MKLKLVIIFLLLFCLKMIDNQVENKTDRNIASTPAVSKKEPRPYKYKFEMDGKKFEVSLEEREWHEGFEDAAVSCMAYFKADENADEDRYLSIIDVCANPHR